MTMQLSTIRRTPRRSSRTWGMTSTRSFWSTPPTLTSTSRPRQSQKSQCHPPKSAHQTRATRASAMEKSSTERNTSMTLTLTRGRRLPTWSTCSSTPICKEIAGIAACWLTVSPRSSTRATTRKMTPLTLSSLKELRSSASVSNLSEKISKWIQVGHNVILNRVLTRILNLRRQRIYA